MAKDLLTDSRETLVVQMQVKKAPPGAWTGKLVTGDTGGEAAAGKPQPKGKEGQALFNKWQANARVDGKIPGALIGRLGMRVKYFISLNKDQQGGRAFAQKFEKLLPRFDAARDWTPSDAIALIDDVSAIEEIPLLNALEDAERNMIRGGEPLPAELADAPWGSPADAAYKPFASPCNLRVAWLLEPRAKEYPLGTPLKSRILVHNAGKETVIFVMPSWQQSLGHTARDASGAAIKVSGVSWTTTAQKTVHRLAPGEYCETPAADVGVGAKTEGEDWANARVGSWIHAKVGDEVRFAPAAVELRCSPSVIGTEMMDGRPLNVEPKDSTDLRQEIIAERVARELPLPSAAAERTQIIRRVTSDLFGEPPTPEEIAAFVADKSPTSRDALVQRLVGRRGVTTLMGAVPSGETLFRVLPVDLDAAKRPRVATGPGWFILGDNQILQVNADKATVLFFAPGPKAKAPGKPCEISLPDGRGTYAIAWERGAGVLWVKQKGIIRSYDFTNRAEVKETTFKEPTDLENVPKRILDALPDVLGAPSRSPPATQAPKLTAEESRMAALLFQGWRDGRDRLASGVFRAHGHLSCDSRDDPHCEGPLDYFCAVDYRKGRLRFDHEIPVVDRLSEKSGKVIGQTFRELGKYYQIPTHAVEWSNRQEDVVYVRKAGTPAVNQAAPFDVRCIGMMTLGDFERFTRYESVRGVNDPQTLTSVSAAGNGVWRLSWTAAQGCKFALWLNRETGYGPIRYEARWPDGREPPIELSQATWTQIGDVWVPKSVKMERNLGPQRSKLDLVFELKSVNQPVPDDLFEFKSLVPPRESAQVISFESGKGMLLERINPPRPAASTPARRVRP